MRYNGSMTSKTLINKETNHFNLPQKTKDFHIQIKRSKKNKIITHASLKEGAELVKQGKVKAISPSDLKSYLDNNYKILDVRPIHEYEKSRIKDTFHIPYFIEDTAMDPLSLVKKVAHSSFAGFWNGTPLMTENENFINDVEKLFNDDNLKNSNGTIVVCGQGLRSLMAIKDMDDAKMKNLCWLIGGLVRVNDKDFDIEGKESLLLSNSGGLSKIIFQLIDKFQNSNSNNSF